MIQIAGATIDENRAAVLKGTLGMLRHLAGQSVRVHRREVRDVALGQEHPPIVRVDQPEQLEKLLLDVGIRREDDRLLARTQSVIRCHEYQLLISWEVAQALSRQQVAARTEVPVNPLPDVLTFRLGWLPTMLVLELGLGNGQGVAAS